MEDSSAVNIVFMAIRGLVALAIVAVAFYCLKQGIQFFMLPHDGADKLQLNIFGATISASGLGAVIFVTGIALCFMGVRAAPKSLTTRKNVRGGVAGIVNIEATENPRPSTEQGASSWSEVTTASQAFKAPAWSEETTVVAELLPKSESGVPFGGNTL